VIFRTGLPISFFGKIHIICVIIFYTLYNHNSGQEACSYITLEKRSEGSGSGSGSGSGIASGDTAYLESTEANMLSINNILTAASYEADLTGLSTLELEGIPGVHSLAGGRISLNSMGLHPFDPSSDVWVMEVIPSPSTRLLNGTAVVTYFRVYFLVSLGSIPMPTWSINVLPNNPFMPDNRSLINF